MCILPQFLKLRNKKRLAICGEAPVLLEWSVSRGEIKGIDLLSPSQLLFLIGQNFPPKVLNPMNLQTVSLMSSCWGDETYVCGWAPLLSLETVPRIPEPLLWADQAPRLVTGGMQILVLQPQEAEPREVRRVSGA